MPATYWLPLPGMRRPARVEHLHAAFSRWFDQSEDDAVESATAPPGDAQPRHTAKVKSYRLAPMSRREGLWGAEVSVLTERAFRSLESHIAQRSVVRLGRTVTPVEVPVVLRGDSWDDLARWPGETAWQVEFLTPFSYRTNSRSSPFPSPSVVLRAAIATWTRFGPGMVEVSPTTTAQLWVSRIDVTTTTYTLNENRHPGALGTITYRADDRDVARTLSPLFRLANYCGMGSFRGKGMGVVSVRSV